MYAQLHIIIIYFLNQFNIRKFILFLPLNTSRLYFFKTIRNWQCFKFIINPPILFFSFLMNVYFGLQIPKYRVVLLGDSGVGKTALVSQFMTSEYMNTYDASLGKAA